MSVPLCLTIEGERLGESQNSNVPAVVINVSVYKGQVAAMVNNGFHLCHIGVDWFIVDGAQQHTPAINEPVPSNLYREVINNDVLQVLEAFSVLAQTLLKIHRHIHPKHRWSRHI